MSPGFLDALQRQGTPEARDLLERAGYNPTKATTPTKVWTYQFKVGEELVSTEAHIRFLSRLLPQEAVTGRDWRYLRLQCANLPLPA